MANNNADVDLLAGLGIDSSEAEILKGVKIIQNWLKTRADAKLKLDIEIDETAINNAITKLQNILQNKNLRIETHDSIMAITEEANAMLDVVDSAKKATQEKLEFAKANQKVRNSADDTANAINRERIAMDNLDDIDVILQNLNMNGRQGNSVFQQFGATLRDAFSTYTVANLLQDAIYKVVDTGKEALDTVKKFDDINVDLQMATGEDKDYVKGLISDYAELGGELGALTETVAESADTFLRQGRSMEETNQLISDAIVLSKVAKTEGEKASEILTATINGFQLAASEGSRVNDVLSSIDLNSASSAEGIGEALTKVASMANNAGVSLEKTAAMIATIKDVTQDADTTIGTSLKTVLSRMNSIRAGKFIDEESGEALNDVEKVLGAIGVTMRDVNGQFKEAEAIIDDVGTKWKSFDSNTQKAVTTAMGGVYQANKLTALFDNYDKVIELTKVAEESAGTALQKFNDSYLPSLEAKTNALKSSLQSLATTTISDEFYGSVLDSTKAIVDMTTETGILKGTLAGLATAGAVYTFQHLATYLHDATQEFANLGEAMQITRNANGSITDIQRLIDLTGGLSQSQTRLLLSTNNLTDAQRTAILVNQYLAQGMDDELARATAEATLQTWGLSTAQQGATGATITLRNALSGLWATLMANPLILVSAAVTVGVTAFNKYKQAQEDTIRATKEAARESANLSDELTELSSKFFSLCDAVKEDESAKEDLLAVQEQLIEKLGLESDELDKLIEKYGSLDEAIKNASISKLQEARHDLISGYDTAKDKLIAESDSIYGNQWTVFSKENKEALKLLEKKGIGRVTDEYVGDRFYLTGSDDTVEGALKNFNQLKDALSALEEQYGADNVKDIGLYNDLYKRYLELKPVIESYMESVDDLNENAASSLQFTMLKDIELPDTEEEITAFRDQLLNAALASKDFVGTQEDIERAIDSVIKTFSSYSKEDIVSSSDDETLTGLLSDKQKESIEEYKALMKKIAEIKENPDSYSLSELTTEFANYDWSKFSDGAESLDIALQKIAGGSLADVRTGLEGFSNVEPILEELSGLFSKTFQINDFGWSENLGHYDFLSDLLKEVQGGKVFNKDEITQILNDYDLYGDIKKLENGFTIDTDALISLINKYAEEHNESLQQVREALEASGINPDSLLGKNSYKTLIDTSQKDSSTKDFSESIDWASHSISILEDKVSDLERVLESTKGWKAQITAIDEVIKAQETLKKGYEESAKTYHGEYEKVLKGISDESVRNALRDSIENGKDFNYELYVDADKETFVDSVNKAIDFYNKFKDAENNVIEVGVKIDEKALEKLQIKADHLSSIRENIETQLNNNISDDLKLELNAQLEMAVANDYGAQIELAKMNGNDLEAEKLQYELHQELANIDAERLEITRAQSQAILDELDLQYEILEAEVESNENGIGTHEQYMKMIENRKDAQETLINDIEREKKRLTEIERVNGENSDEYRIQFTVVAKLISELLGVRSALQGIQSDLGSLVQNDIDEAMGNLDEEIEGVNDQLESVNKQLEQMDAIIAGAQAYIQDQIDAQEELKKPIEEQLEAMKEANDERERALALEKARYELERAQQQRTVKVYREDKGFVYETNRDDIRNAQENLDKLEYEEVVNQLEKQLDYYDEIIENLQEIKDAWGSVAQNAQDALNIQKALSAVGADGIMSIDVAKSYEAQYQGLLSQEESLNGQIDSLEDRKDELNDFWKQYQQIIKKWEDGDINALDTDEKFRTLFADNQEMIEREFPDSPYTTITQKWLDDDKLAHNINLVTNDLIGRVSGSMDEFVREGSKDVESAVQSVVDVIDDFFEQAKGWEEEEFNFGELLGDTSELTNALTKMSDWGYNTALYFDPEYGQSFEEFLLSVLGANEGTKYLVQTLTELDSVAQQTTVDTVNDSIDEFGNTVGDMEGDVKKMSDATEQAGEDLNKLGDDATNAGNNVSGAMESASGSIDATALSTMSLDDKMNYLIQTVGNLSATNSFSAFAENASSAFSAVSSSIDDVIGKINSLQSAINGAISSINSIGSTAQAQISVANDALSQVQDIASNMNSTVMGATSSAIRELKQTTEDFVKDFIGSVENSFNQKKDDDNSSKEIGQEIGKAVKETLSSKATPAGSKHDMVNLTYHTGIEKGYVGGSSSDSKRLEVLRKASNGNLAPDEVVAVLQKGEVVLTKGQQVNLVDNLMQRSIMPNVNIPDYSHLKDTVQRNNTQPVVQNVTVNCPNLTGETGFNEFKRQLEGLQLKAIQYANKR